MRQLSVRPLAVFDRGYGNANFVNQTQGINCDLLLRLASNRCVYGAPAAYKGRGAPSKHGHKFKFNDPETWPDPDEIAPVTPLVQSPVWKANLTQKVGNSTRKSLTIGHCTRTGTADLIRAKAFWVSEIGFCPSLPA